MYLGRCDKTKDGGSVLPDIVEVALDIESDRSKNWAVNVRLV